MTFVPFYCGTSRFMCMASQVNLHKLLIRLFCLPGFFSAIHSLEALLETSFQILSVLHSVTCSLAYLKHCICTFFSFQDMCVSDSCGRGYYRAILSPEQADSSIVGDLIVGSDVCIPCDELCEECTGPGKKLELNACQVCKNATQGTQCVAECDRITGEETMDRLWLIMWPIISMEALLGS